MVYLLGSVVLVLGLGSALATIDAVMVLGFGVAGLAIGWLAGLTNTAIAPSLLAALLGTTAIAQAVVPAAAYFSNGGSPLAAITVISCACAIGFTVARCEGVARFRVGREPVAPDQSRSAMRNAVSTPPSK